jgi:hypothetical protein
MATFVNGNGAKDDTSDTSMAVTVTGVSAGNLIVVLAKWEGAGGATCSVSDGTSSLTQDPDGIVEYGNNDLNGCMFYLLSSVASGSVTYTMTLSGARAFKQMSAGAFSYSGTATFEDSNRAAVAINGGDATYTAPAITIAGSELVTVAGYGNFTTQTPDARTINGVAADGFFGNADGTQCWYRLLGSGFTAGPAVIDMPTALATESLMFQIAFEITAGAASTLLLERQVYDYFED